MNFISRIIKSINAMRERLKIERHEAMYGPHFNEECALKAVSKMENEDGSRGEHWSLEETTSIANQYGLTKVVYLHQILYSLMQILLTILLLMEYVHFNGDNYHAEV